MDTSELSTKLSDLQNKIKEISENECDTPIQKLNKLENLGDELLPLIESPDLQRDDESTKDITAELQSTIKNLDKLQGQLLSETKNQFHKSTTDNNYTVYQPKTNDSTPSNRDDVSISSRDVAKKNPFLSKIKDIMPKFKGTGTKKYSNQMVMDLHQKLLEDDVFVEDSKILMERTAKLKRLEEELVGIQDMYIQVSDQTMAQGEQLDSIENNVSTATNYSRAMNEEFNVTIERNTWSRKLVIASITVALLCIAIIYFSFNHLRATI